MSLYETLRRAIAMVLAVSMMLAVLPAAAAEEAVIQPLEPEGEPVVLPLDPDDGAVILPEGPDDDADLPTEGGTPVITWPDPDDTDEPESDDPANIPVTLPLFPDEELDGAAAEGVCKDLITEVGDTGTEVIRWPEPGDAKKDKIEKQDDDSELPTEESGIKTHTGDCSFTIDKGSVEATCKEGAYTLTQCSLQGRLTKLSCSRVCKKYTSKPLTHSWDVGTIEQPYPCQPGTKTQNCTRKNCDGINVTPLPATQPHDYFLKLSKAATCTEAGEGIYTCKVCGHENGTDTIPALGGECEMEPVVEFPTCTESGKSYQKCKKCDRISDETTLNALDHALDDGTIEQPYPCLPGTKTKKCTREDCDYSVGEPVEATAEHIPGTWTDTDQPGCCEQVFTTNCTVCGDEMEKKSPALREHKFSQYAIDRFICSYCNEEVEKLESWKDAGLALLVEGGAVGLSNSATGIIQDVLNETMAEINKAETREEAITALEDLHGTLVKRLQQAGKVTIKDWEIGISESMAEQILESLGITGILEQVTKGADESFLSKESLQASVSKVVETVVSEDGTAVTKECVHDVLFSELFGLIGRDDLAPKYDTATDELILQLAQTAVADDAYWDALTEGLVNDLLNEALKGLQGDKLANQVGDAVAEAIKDALPYSLMGLWFGDVVGGFTTDVYRMYTGSEQFEELFDEVGDVVRDQIAKDPTFVNDVRQIVESATARAKEGVQKGWTEEKIYANLRSDLSGVDQLVNDRVASLGDDAAVLLQEKVAETIKDALPYNVFGLWLGDSLGGFTNDLVNIAAEKGGESVSKTIRDYIRYYTCPKHQLVKFVVSEASCTGAKVLNAQCTLCGWVEDNFTTEGDPLGHDVVTDVAVEPTQLADGQTEGSHCARCGEVFVKQQSIPMLDPDIYAKSEYHRAITEADAIALGYASLEDLNAALDDAVCAAGFDPANSIRFTAQINSSIGILPNDRFPSGGVQTLLPIPDAAAQEYYAVQVYTADVQSTNFHPAGEFAVTPVKQYADSLGLNLYTQAIVILAWKA